MEQRETSGYVLGLHKRQGQKQVGYCLGDMGKKELRMVVTAAKVGLEAQGLHLYSHQVNLSHWYLCNHCYVCRINTHLHICSYIYT